YAPVRLRIARTRRPAAVMELLRAVVRLMSRSPPWSPPRRRPAEPRRPGAGAAGRGGGRTLTTRTSSSVKASSSVHDLSGLLAVRSTLRNRR
ncbi:hypothetical protein LV779_13480, partial [Streptomyces thinghirensis]|nr:hypothetical protein [Streptomyces thinghirensis]